MQKASNIKKNGVYTDGIVTHINTIRSERGGAIDILTLEYKDRATGQPYTGSASVTTKNYKVGSDVIPIIYLFGKPVKYAIDTKKAFGVVLIVNIILFVIVLFSVSLLYPTS